MKFFVDENVNAGCLDPLRSTYRAHEFRYAFDEGLSSTNDIPLFETLAKRRYHAIITKDRQQLRNEDERRALFDAGLHWIGHNAKEHNGLKGIAIETATVTAGLIFVLANWHPQPHIYRLRGIETEVSQRVRMTAVELEKWGLPPQRGLSLA
ncbi:Uncharacterised protein [Mycobacteroides abscessus subsp. massiliense]|uniref:PIN-like domain-containing protein n=1 Tax=Mycobacteroides abscessus TaxID=36809 RepID=UPI0009A8DDC1|nr:hypothetical protein [Mycobacteroides abscessus]SLH95636.1 Uncharacterised protein [Mycobacteroides abscessus subsp. massiliense]SLI84650.1 Uncharacterised protein [Mycobacteroides abscessus subsp. massiliense]